MITGLHQYTVAQKTALVLNEMGEQGNELTKLNKPLITYIILRSVNNVE